VFTTVIEATATPTETETPTNTPTNTPTLGPICEDIFEPDDDRGSAKVIDVNLPQPQEERDPDFDDRRAICPAGDEDWLIFGAVQGKVYTIDTRDVAAGLDLSLGLFDEDGNRIEFNDDFFGREPVINPRIQFWTAPYTGNFYIQVREVTNRGGIDRTYRIELIDESFGPTPVIPEDPEPICEDLYEPDGLPEQANLITSNELQRNRRFCPEGDADWLTFFGKANKDYFIYTDTRNYIRDNSATGDSQAGADTVLVLTDRDGVSVIDVNDDIPGGDTLDSQIEFQPVADGFYYIQVKNVGDIGNQFIRYDVALELCIPGRTDCGRISSETLAVQEAPASTPTPTPQRAATAQGSTPAPTATATVPLQSSPKPASNTATPDLR
jgi:hypothetical protein